MGTTETVQHLYTTKRIQKCSHCTIEQGTNVIYQSCQNIQYSSKLSYSPACSHKRKKKQPIGLTSATSSSWFDREGDTRLLPWRRRGRCIGTASRPSSQYKLDNRPRGDRSHQRSEPVGLGRHRPQYTQPVTQQKYTTNITLSIDFGVV